MISHLWSCRTGALVAHSQHLQLRQIALREIPRGRTPRLTESKSWRTYTDLSAELCEGGAWGIFTRAKWDWHECHGKMQSFSTCAWYLALPTLCLDTLDLSGNQGRQLRIRPVPSKYLLAVAIAFLRSVWWNNASRAWSCIMYPSNSRQLLSDLVLWVLCLSLFHYCQLKVKRKLIRAEVNHLRKRRLDLRDICLHSQQHNLPFQWKMQLQWIVEPGRPISIHHISRNLHFENISVECEIWLCDKAYLPRLNANLIPLSESMSPMNTLTLSK